MFPYYPAKLLALIVCVTISNAYVLPPPAPPGPASSDVCHNAKSLSSSLQSLMGLCDGVPSSASGMHDNVSNCSCYICIMYVGRYW